MAGNSQRRGAVRTGNKKGPQVGSGGQRRRGLEGKGPTPKASERPNHKAHKAANAAERRGGGQAGRTSTRKNKASSEMVAGRNSVLEALRADVPVTTMYVAGRIDSDDRVREAMKIATERGIPVLETPRGELDRLTDGSVHQGLALQVPPYEYAHPSDLIDPEAPGIPLVVALDGITDPRNLGAIVRSVAAFGGDDGLRVEVVRRCRGADPGGPGHQPEPGSRGLQEGRLLHHRPRHGRRRRAARPRARLRAARGRRRVRGQGPVAPRARALRPDRVGADELRGGVAQRRHRHRRHPVRGRSPPSTALTSRFRSTANRRGGSMWA